MKSFAYGYENRNLQSFGLMNTSQIKKKIIPAVFLIVFIVCFFIPKFSYEIEHQTHLVMAICYLSVPFLIIGFVLYFRVFTDYRKKTGPAKGILTVIVTAVVLTLMTSNYLLLINAKTGRQTTVLIEGNIIEMKDKSLKLSRMANLFQLTDYLLIIEEKHTRQIRELEISRKQFKALKDQNYYSEQWLLGSLNLLYRTH
jgi:hypothetical protein